jgi:hypothetical protein
MVTVEDPGDFLKGEFVKGENITKIRIVDTPKYEEGDFGKQLICNIECNNEDKTRKKFRFNNTNIRHMIKQYEKNSENWKDKEINIQTVMQNTPSGMKDVIYITDN